MESKLKKTQLDKKQQAKVNDLIEHNEVFSLCDRLGTGSQMEVHLKLWNGIEIVKWNEMYCKCCVCLTS